MKRSNLFYIVRNTLFLFIGVVIAMQWAGCSDASDLVGSTTTQTERGFILKDSASDAQMGDTVWVNQVLLLLGALPNGITASSWQINWGDNTAISTGTGSQIMAIHKYTSAGVVVIVLTVVDQNNQTHEYRRTVTVLQYQATYQPVFKVLNATLVSPGVYDYTLAFLRKAIECSNTNPFYVDTISGWVPDTLGTDSTADGYLIKIKRFSDNTTNGFTYGGNYNANCFASIAPRTGQWSSAYYVFNPSTNSHKLYARFSGGQAYTLGGGTPTTYPGPIGDSGSAPVMRLGFGVTQDTIYIYFNKMRCSGTQQPTWSNSVDGINNQLGLSEVSGHPDWWCAKFLRSRFPTSAFGCVYRTFNGLASMTGSYFWDPTDNWLEFQVAMIGDAIQITAADGKTFNL